MQISISNLNRSCVSLCENGQYGNPFTFTCSQNPLDCPDGYYADSHVKMCVKNCTVAGQVAENSTKKCQTSCSTGFAYWEARICVLICPANPSLFGYIAGKVCVPNCNYSTTFLYGDAQANRTCVQKCSASPTPTFGKNSTSLCVDKCPGSTEYGDPLDPFRRCVSTCTSTPLTYAYSVTKMCVTSCPSTYYAAQDSSTGNKGVCVQSCASPLFADPVTNTCRAICKDGYFGYPSGIRPCLLFCPKNWFGMNGTTNRVCVQNCDNGFWGDIETSMCYNVKVSCSNNTYADPIQKLCVIAANCFINSTYSSFADPFTKGCETNCSNGYYADSHIRTCIPVCQ